MTDRRLTLILTATLAGLGALTTGLADNGVTALEWVAVASTVIAALLGVQAPRVRSRVRARRLNRPGRSR